VVEKEGDLYIILDMNRIFSMHKDEDNAASPVQTAPLDNAALVQAAQAAPAKAEPTESDLGFVRDELKALRGFYAGPVNDVWVQSRFQAWAEGRSGSALQLRNADEADQFLAEFYSPCTNKFWDDNYASAIKASLPDMGSANIQVWNPGCGKGYESYSFACILKNRYPGARIKIWANDKDLMAIANAPNMAFDLSDLPEYVKPFMVKGKNGWNPNQELKDMVLFEYHDVMNGNQIPEVDIILIRDMISFMTPESQDKLIGELTEHLKKGGVVMLGANEIITDMQASGWQSVGKPPVSAFVRG
jgi:purine-binding chemotaxis protein CheW